MSKKILIFGGSGFIGANLVSELLKSHYQVCVVCTDKEKALRRIGNDKNLQISDIDIFSQNKLTNLIAQYDIIINLIGKLFESKKGDFAQFHHHFPKKLAQNISPKQHLIHISALAIENSAKSSIYAKSKLDGENIIRKNCQNYNIIKPSIVFGKLDNFFNLFAKMAIISPFLPLIGGGKARFSPIYVKDLVKSIIFLIENNKKYKNRIFEAYGPKTLTFKELMQFILKTTKKSRILLNLPFSLAKLQAKFLNLLKIYILTSDQVELLKYDNIATKKYDNIDDIIGDLQKYQDIVPNYLNNKSHL